MKISIVTSNISADFLTPPGVPAWDERKALVVGALRVAQPNLIALQEVTPRQLHFLQEQLPQFTPLTVPVIDPDPDLLAAWQAKYARYGLPQIPDPYENVLFYHTDTFALVASDYWWLSPTPHRPSIGFGNVAPRAVLWAHLRHIASDQEFLVFTTHIDHRCTQAMVELCRSRLAVFSEQGLPQILAGDLNFNPNDANYARLLADGWCDAHTATTAVEAPTMLYDLPELMPAGRIDHVLYRGSGLVPISWARLVSPDPDRRLSDHDPVQVQFNDGGY